MAARIRIGRASRREGNETMTNPIVELAVHMKLATEAVLEAAEHLSALDLDDAGAAATAACSRVMDELIALNTQLGLMERILRVVTHQAAPAAGII
jgi:hypothetical protein